MGETHANVAVSPEYNHHGVAAAPQNKTVLSVKPELTRLFHARKSELHPALFFFC